jgi:hypothetical protein
MRRAVVLLLALAACAQDDPVRHYGFVATLGNDTVSVEQVTRNATALVSDEVDRFPLVRQRHTEFALAPDGKVTHMVMRVRTPNGATPAERGRLVTAAFTRDSVFIVITDSAGVSKRAFRTNGALTVPHVSMMYSVIEHEIATSLRSANAVGDSVPFRQFYPDRDVGPTFVLHSGWVQRRPGDSVMLRHDWLSGRGDVTMDRAGGMQTYSGQRSTYKVEVKRSATTPDIDTLALRFAAAERTHGVSQLSIRDTTRAAIGNAAIVIDYGRPLLRGRTLLGNVISYDRVWRTGANAATQFTTSAPITLAGIPLAKGTYSLWTVPHTSGVELIVNSESGQWGTEHDSAKDIGTATLQSEVLATPVEKFAIRVTTRDARHGALVMEWGTFRWLGAMVAQ